VVDGDRRLRAVIAVLGDHGNFVGDVLAFDHFAEDGVLVVEPAGGGNGDKKLAAIGVGSGIGHGKFAGFGMLERRMKFVGEFVAGAAHAGAMRASALNHEIGNDAVEDQAVVKRARFFLAGFFVGEFLGAFGETNEIGDGFGSFVDQKLDHDIAERSFKDGVGASGTCHAVSLD